MKNTWQSGVLKTAVPAILLTTTSPLHAHTLTTATGYYVSHGHYNYCGPNGCPIADSTFEAQVGFSAWNRVYSGTGAWNCHGRTFDARRSWTPLADPWLYYDGPVSPYSPAQGDSIIWWSGGSTSHSVTITGPWNSISTPVMSKYGTQGQYSHSLANTIRVYGSNWAVVRFTAGTPIYYGLQASAESSKDMKVDEKTVEEIRDRLLKEREQMPWYQAVRDSETLYKNEHPQLVAKVGGLREHTQKLIAQYKADEKRTLDALFDDLKDSEHYAFLGVYNSPAHSEDFIKGIEAGNLLVKMAEKHPHLRPIIISRLRDAFAYENMDFQDRFRGATLYFLSQILSPEERKQAKGQLKTSMPAQAEMAAGVPTYTQYYFDKL